MYWNPELQTTPENQFGGRNLNRLRNLGMQRQISNPYIKPTPIGGNTVQPGISQQPETTGQGWWTPPAGGYSWAQGKYSPQFTQLMEKMYNMPSLAEGYKGFLEKSPELEQMEYNRALSRLKGLGTAAKQGLATTAASRRGTMGGGYAGSLDEINRALLTGGMDIATTQAMQNLAQREQRQQNLLGYQAQDIANQTGWLGQMMPWEQYNINMPFQQAVTQEQINAARRGEQMGWFDRMMNMYNLMGQQYYGGQGQWLGYKGQQGQNILGGYGPQWVYTG